MGLARGPVDCPSSYTAVGGSLDRSPTATIHASAGVPGPEESNPAKAQPHTPSTVGSSTYMAVDLFVAMD